MNTNGLIVMPNKKIDPKINDLEQQKIIDNAVALIKQKGYDIRPFKNAEVFPNHWLIKYPHQEDVHKVRNQDGLPKGPGPACNVSELLDLAEKLPIYQHSIETNKKKTLVLKKSPTKELG